MATLTGGAIIIPAHNEEAVIGRTLQALGPVLTEGNAEVLVVCNGCTDSTAAVARSFEGVRVVQIDQASKIAALNEGDRLAAGWPRLYLDADIEVEPDAVARLFQRLGAGDVLAARPSVRYEEAGTALLVRSYYRARTRLLPSQGALWGSGAYAVSRDGHARFAAFPDVVADDLFIDRLFADGEKTVVAHAAVAVRTPSDVAGLMAILRRTYRGNREQVAGAGTRNRSMVELARSVRGPGSAWDAAVYAGFAVAGRFLRPRTPGPVAWERDNSSRVAPATN